MTFRKIDTGMKERALQLITEALKAGALNASLRQRGSQVAALIDGLTNVSFGSVLVKPPAVILDFSAALLPSCEEMQWKKTRLSSSRLGQKDSTKTRAHQQCIHCIGQP